MDLAEILYRSFFYKKRCFMPIKSVSATHWPALMTMLYHQYMALDHSISILYKLIQVLHCRLIGYAQSIHLCYDIQIIYVYTIYTYVLHIYLKRFVLLLFAQQRFVIYYQTIFSVSFLKKPPNSQHRIVAFINICKKTVSSIKSVITQINCLICVAYISA